MDDILVASMSKVEVLRVNTQLNKEFKMKELVQANRIMGMEIVRGMKQKKIFLT